MREYEKIEQAAIAEIKRLGAEGYNVDELKMLIGEMNILYDKLEIAARERVSVTEAFSDAAKTWPYLNQPDQAGEEETTNDIEKLQNEIKQLQAKVEELQPAADNWAKSLESITAYYDQLRSRKKAAALSHGQQQPSSEQR